MMMSQRPQRPPMSHPRPEQPLGMSGNPLQGLLQAQSVAAPQAQPALSHAQMMQQEPIPSGSMRPTRRLLPATASQNALLALQRM